MEKKAVKTIPFKDTAYYKSVEKRVERGVKFLDKAHKGRSWVKKVKLGLLNMGNGNTCVIGQVYGGWGSMVTSEAAVYNGYILTEKQAARLGFQSKHVLKPSGEDGQKEQKEFDTLQIVWLDKLRKLKKIK